MAGRIITVMAQFPASQTYINDLKYDHYIDHI
jgi:hypothetical protein